MAVTPQCVLTPDTEEGPYFVEERLFRSDIRDDPRDGSRQNGVPLSLAFRVVRADEGCAPVKGAYMDVWHCNAQGVYSDEPAEGTVGKRFLRGCQRTNTGWVRFTTIVPGWYAGRSVHIHFKIRLLRDGDQVTYQFTSQLFFEDPLIRELHMTRDPYRARGAPQLSNDDDPIFGDEGWKLVLPTASDDRGGYTATIESWPRPREAGRRFSSADQ